MNTYFRCLESRIDKNNTLYGKFSLNSILSGQGNTFANSLRRSLFSDLSGLAITHFCITSKPGLGYEFATLPGLAESVLDFSLNLKKVVLTGRVIDHEMQKITTLPSNLKNVYNGEKSKVSTPYVSLPSMLKSKIYGFDTIKDGIPVNIQSFTGKESHQRTGKSKMTCEGLRRTQSHQKRSSTLSIAPIGFLKAKGPAVLRAKDLILPPGIRCVHPNQYLGTLAADGALSIKFLIAVGKGFIVQDEILYNSLSRAKLLLSPNGTEINGPNLDMQAKESEIVSLSTQNKKKDNDSYFFENRGSNTNISSLMVTRSEKLPESVAKTQNKIANQQKSPVENKTNGEQNNYLFKYGRSPKQNPKKVDQKLRSTLSGSFSDPKIVSAHSNGSSHLIEDKLKTSTTIRVTYPFLCSTYVVPLRRRQSAGHRKFVTPSSPFGVRFVPTYGSEASKLKLHNNKDVNSDTSDKSKMTCEGLRHTHETYPEGAPLYAQQRQYVRNIHGDFTRRNRRFLSIQPIRREHLKAQLKINFDLPLGKAYLRSKHQAGMVRLKDVKANLWLKKAYASLFQYPSNSSNICFSNTKTNTQVTFETLISGKNKKPVLINQNFNKITNLSSKSLSLAKLPGSLSDPKIAFVSKVNFGLEKIQKSLLSSSFLGSKILIIKKHLNKEDKLFVTTHLSESQVCKARIFEASGWSKEMLLLRKKSHIDVTTKERTSPKILDTRPVNIVKLCSYVSMTPVQDVRFVRPQARNIQLLRIFDSLSIFLLEVNKQGYLRSAAKDNLRSEKPVRLKVQLKKQSVGAPFKKSLISTGYIASRNSIRLKGKDTKKFKKAVGKATLGVMYPSVIPKNDRYGQQSNTKASQTKRSTRMSLRFNAQSFLPYGVFTNTVNSSKKLLKKQLIWGAEENFYPVLPLDVTFTPVSKVNFQINVDRNSEKNEETIIFEIWTNGSITPKRAIQESCLALAQNFYNLFCHVNEFSSLQFWWKRESMESKVTRAGISPTVRGITSLIPKQGQTATLPGSLSDPKLVSTDITSLRTSNGHVLTTYRRNPYFTSKKQLPIYLLSANKESSQGAFKGEYQGFKQSSTYKDFLCKKKTGFNFNQGLFLFNRFILYPIVGHKLQMNLPWPNLLHSTQISHKESSMIADTQQEGSSKARLPEKMIQKIGNIDTMSEDGYPQFQRFITTAPYSANNLDIMVSSRNQTSNKKMHSQVKKCTKVKFPESKNLRLKQKVQYLHAFWRLNISDLNFSLKTQLLLKKLNINSVYDLHFFILKKSWSLFLNRQQQKEIIKVYLNFGLNSPF